MNSIGARIRQRREALGLSQTRLAELVGESKQTIYKYEKDLVVSIPLGTIEALARCLSTTPAWLVGWADTVTHLPDTLRESEAYRQAVADLAGREEWLDELAALYIHLNELGRQVAVERVEELTANPKYQRKG